jgi:hypothetical protein
VSSPPGGGRAGVGCGSGSNPGCPGFTVGSVSDKVSHQERLAAAHARLTEAIAQVATSEDWRRLLRLSSSFHRYSPNNQLLLAVQGAEGLVASFNTWKRIPAVDGRACRIKKGSTALRVYAPVRTVRRDVDQDTGDEIVERSVTRFKLVPVFHQGQLVAPPDIPVQPQLLIGAEPDGQLWDAVARHITDAGFTLQRGPLHGVDGAKGVTNWADRTVTVRDDLAPAQALKTEIHELGHVLLHHPDHRPEGISRDRMEVEAESVAYVVCDTVGVNAGDYSIPYVANWAGADSSVVRATAERVLDTARTIVARLEEALGVELVADPIASARRRLDEEGVEQPVARAATPGTTDQLIADHLATGPLDWPRLVHTIPAIAETRGIAVADDPVGQAIALAEAGASARATASVLRAHDLDDDAIRAALTATVPDSLGESRTLFSPQDAAAALNEPTPIKPLVDELVADLLVSAGRHPRAALHLAHTSGQPASVISLVEERLRRRENQQPGTIRDPGIRGLALIDEWRASAPRPVDQAPSEPAPAPEPPEPPAA